MSVLGNSLRIFGVMASNLQKEAFDRGDGLTREYKDKVARAAFVIEAAMDGVTQQVGGEIAIAGLAEIIMSIASAAAEHDKALVVARQ